MNETETLPNMNELGESEYIILKETYCRLQGLRSDIKVMHDQYTADGTPPVFSEVESLYLQVEELFEELERFLLPVCSTSSCGPDMCEQ